MRVLHSSSILAGMKISIPVTLAGGSKAGLSKYRNAESDSLAVNNAGLARASVRCLILSQCTMR